MDMDDLKRQFREARNQTHDRRDPKVDTTGLDGGVADRIREAAESERREWADTRRREEAYRHSMAEQKRRDEELDAHAMQTASMTMGLMSSRVFLLGGAGLVILLEFGTFLVGLWVLAYWGFQVLRSGGALLVVAAAVAGAVFGLADVEWEAAWTSYMIAFLFSGFRTWQGEAFDRVFNDIMMVLFLLSIVCVLMRLDRLFDLPGAIVHRLLGAIARHSRTLAHLLHWSLRLYPLTIPGVAVLWLGWQGAVDVGFGPHPDGILRGGWERMLALSAHPFDTHLAADIFVWWPLATACVLLIRSLILGATVRALPRAPAASHGVDADTAESIRLQAEIDRMMEELDRRNRQRSGDPGRIDGDR